jgi:DNA-binding IclR family transcriptional regulator
MKPKQAESDRAKGINSLETGYRVLLAIQRGPGSVQLSEIASRTGLSTGATHNYVVSLIRTGLVEQESRGRYRLGPSAFALSLSSFEQLNGYDTMRVEAFAVHSLTGQSAALSVWSQGGPVSVYIERSATLGRIDLRPGHLPMIRSAAGILYAAYLPPDQTMGIIREELGGDASAAAADRFIAKAREQVAADGMAFIELDDEAGSFIIAAPVITERHEIACILSVICTEANEREPIWRKALENCAERASLMIAQMPVSGPAIDTDYWGNPAKPAAKKTRRHSKD